MTADVRLQSALRRNGARGASNLDAGLHERKRRYGWRHCDTEVWRLGHSQLRDVYAGFTIGHHTLTHPHLEQLPIAAARREIGDGRAPLQDLFGQTVSSFAYPIGTFDDGVAQAVRDAGHLYPRTTGAADTGVGTHDAMTAAPSCHFLAQDFWQRLDRARPTGALWFLGHSYELVDGAIWTAFEASLARLCAKPGVQWCNPTELFDGGMP